MTTTEKKTRVYKKDYSGFQSYILKILKENFKDASISGIALNQLSDLTRILIDEIGHRSVVICRRLKTITFTSRTIQFATRSILTGELQRNAVSEGAKRTTIYNVAIAGKSSSTPVSAKRKSSTLQNKAQLTLSPSRVMSVLRGFRYRISVSSGVYCAAVIEYLLVEILELALGYAHYNKKVKITSKHIQTAIRGDEELNFLADALKIEFSMGGVVPFIHSELLPTEEKTKKNSKNRIANRKEKGITGYSVKKLSGTNETRKGRRALPGTKAIRDIRKYQKTVGILGQKAPFERVARTILKSIKQEFRFSAQVLDQLQLFCETRIVDFYSKAQLLAINSGREGIMSNDINTVYKLQNNVFQDLAKDIIVEDIYSMKPSLKRMARKGGVKRLSGQTYESMLKIYTGIIYTVLLAAANETQMLRSKTITIATLKTSIYSLGFNFILSNS